jgi:hypothetical protein
MDEQKEAPALILPATPKQKKINSSVILLRSGNNECSLPWTALLKDGAVYQIGDSAHQTSGQFVYLCQYARFKPSRDDELISGGSKVPTIDIPNEVIDVVEGLSL